MSAFLSYHLFIYNQYKYLIYNQSENLNFKNKKVDRNDWVLYWKEETLNETPLYLYSFTQLQSIITLNKIYPLY
jgi:hypothetical protein